MESVSSSSPMPAGSAVPFPTFAGNVIKRPVKYEQKVGGKPSMDEYTVHAYQYATSTKPGYCTPAAIIYATSENDIKLAIQYCVAANISLAIRSSGHQYEGFSSTSGQNIQLDMSNFNTFKFDETTRTITAGVGINLGTFDKECIKVDAFVPHGQCGTVCLGGHMQTGGYSVLCGRSFGMFCDYIVSFRMITADGNKIEVHKPDPKKKDTANDDLWFAVIGGSPGNFGVILNATIKPLRISDYPNMRCSTTYMHFSSKSYKVLLDIAAECNDNDELAADWNICTFFLAKAPISPNTNIDTEMMDNHPEFYGEKIPAHPDVIGLWVTWCNLDGGTEVPEDVKKFFSDIEERTKPYVYRLETLALKIMSKIFGKVVAVYSPDKPATMETLMGDFCFDARVHANPYVSATWCGDSQSLTKNGFAEWATEVTAAAKKQDGCYTDFEWVVSGGKYSRNFTNVATNPMSVPWRDVKMLAFLYIHYDNTDSRGRDWEAPGKFARKLVEQMQTQAIGPQGKLSTKLRFWKAFPAAGADMDRDHEFYFASKEDYERILKIKEAMDPNNVFTPNMFCVGANRQDPSKFNHLADEITEAKSKLLDHVDDEAPKTKRSKKI